MPAVISSSDRDFLALAEWWGTRKSKDPSTKVGAIITRPDRTIASVGYNGFPRGVADSLHRYLDRNQKYLLVVHAETNAILTAREPLHGYTIFTSAQPPCARCSGQIIQAGITRIVCPVMQNDRWIDDHLVALEMLREAGIQLDLVAL